MYPHSALVGGGTREYYPNDIARELSDRVQAAPRIGLRALVASLLARHRERGQRTTGAAARPMPSPFHPSVMAKVVLPETGSPGCELEGREVEHVADRVGRGTRREKMAATRKRTWVLIGAMLVVPLLAASAVADVVTRRDPKDTPGRLDIQRISHGHAGDDAVVHTVSMYRRFPSKLLKPRGRAIGVFLFDQSEETIRIVEVRWRNGRLRAPIFDLWTDRRVGAARVNRPNPRTVRIVIPKRFLGELGEHPGYYWFAASVYTDRGACKGEGCWDVAPNRRAVRHFIPEEIPPEEPPEDIAGVSQTMDAIIRAGALERLTGS